MSKCFNFKKGVVQSSNALFEECFEMAKARYVDALMKTEKRIEDMQQRSQGLSGQAASLRNIAVGTANLAVAKQVRG